MSYEKHNFQSGATLYASQLNEMDEQILHDSQTIGEQGEALEQLQGEARRLLEAFPRDTAAGAAASFPDGAEDIPVRDLTVNIEPVQDLHGYDHPWPSGGGKNLLDQTSMSNITWNNGVGTISCSNKSYYSASGPIFTAKSGVSYTASCRMKAITVATGWKPRIAIRNTSYQILAFGEWHGPASEEEYVSITYTPEEDIEVYISFIITGPSASDAQTEVREAQLEIGNTPTAFEPYSNICPISGWTGAEVSVSPTEDEEDGDTYSVSWQTEAGTVYGGTLDVTTGVLTANMATVDLGDIEWTLRNNTQNRQAWRGEPPGMKPVDDDYPLPPNMLCSEFKTVIPNSAWGPYQVTQYDGRLICCVSSNEYETPAAFKSAMSGVQLVYELVTPISYQLTPTEVTTLLGENNIWADCGAVTVEYRADPTLYINKHVQALTALMSEL